MFVCVLCLYRDSFHGLTWEIKTKRVWSVNLYMTELECPEVTQCGWQDVNYPVTNLHILLMCVCDQTCVCCQCNVVGFGCGLQWCWCTFHSIKPMLKTVFRTESSLFLSQNLTCLLFLCVLSLRHTLIALHIPHSQLRIAVFNMCCTEPVIQSTDHSLTCKHIHSQLTIHSYSVITTGTRCHTTTPVLLLLTCFSVHKFIY